MAQVQANAAVEDEEQQQSGPMPLTRLEVSVAPGAPHLEKCFFFFFFFFFLFVLSLSLSHTGSHRAPACQRPT
jgi:hypothetical protein